MNYVRRFWNDEEGLETVEYAIILGLIVAGTIALVVAIGEWVNGAFQDAATEMGIGDDGGGG